MNFWNWSFVWYKTLQNSNSVIYQKIDLSLLQIFIQKQLFLDIVMIQVWFLTGIHAVWSYFLHTYTVQ